MRWMNVDEPICGWVQQDIPHCDSAVPPPWILARPNMRMHNYTRAYERDFPIRYHLGGTLQSDSEYMYNLGDFVHGRCLCVCHGTSTGLYNQFPVTEISLC